jgi:cytidylate kinase
MADPVIITIDGPAGSGKSTAARGLARRLGIRYFNSGALYRAVTWLGMEDGIDLDDSVRLLDRLSSVRIETHDTVEGERLLIDGCDVTGKLFQNEISRQVYHVADVLPIRRAVGRLARRLNEDVSFVAEGRDQGTIVFPEADVKFYLDAHPDERADRRWKELRERGEDVPRETVLREIRERDRRDFSRPVGPLKKPDDAIVVDNSQMTLEETVERLFELTRRRLSELRLM